MNHVQDATAYGKGRDWVENAFDTYGATPWILQRVAVQAANDVRRIDAPDYWVGVFDAIAKAAADMKAKEDAR